MMYEHTVLPSLLTLLFFPRVRYFAGWASLLPVVAVFPLVKTSLKIPILTKSLLVAGPESLGLGYKS